MEFFNSFKRKQLKEGSNLHSKDINNISCSSCHLKVGLQNVDSSWKCFMSTTTEQCNTSIQQYGSNQRCIGNTSQAFDATLKASYKKKKKRKLLVNILYQGKEKCFFFYLVKCFCKLKMAGQRQIRSGIKTHKSVREHRLIQLLSFLSCYLAY